VVPRGWWWLWTFQALVVVSKSYRGERASTDRKTRNCTALWSIGKQFSHDSMIEREKRKTTIGSLMMDDNYLLCLRVQSLDCLVSIQ
jgi:hypothetical protein